MDKVDNLVERLNGIEGIEFVRDAWNEKAPDTYGVVELDGADRTLWTDDGMSEQSFRLTITAYVGDGSDLWVRNVQNVLNELGLSYSLPQRAYDYDLNKVMWQWQAYIYGPLITEA